MHWKSALMPNATTPYSPDFETTIMTQTVFIADLHLSEASPALNQLFAASLQRWADEKIDALYILGDLFDAWIGDDDDHPFIHPIQQQLRQFSATVPTYFMHGNRDFLLGQTFATAAGLQLLPEQHQIELYGQTCVLAHGDQLCTDDLPYMQFRQQSRNPLWQQAILAKPLAERRLLAAQIRQISEQGKSENGKTAISDATETAIIALMQAHPVATTLIHGHTHRPAVHHHRPPEGHPFVRHVLQDWYGKTGGCLKVSVDGIESEILTL